MDDLKRLFNLLPPTALAVVVAALEEEPAMGDVLWLARRVMRDNRGDDYEVLIDEAREYLYRPADAGDGPQGGVK